MAQFDVYRFAPRGAGFAYVVDLQNDLLEAFATRIVAPLYPVKGKQQPILRLNPVFQIDGKPHYCVSAWNKNPVGGVIGVQTGPL